MILRSKVDELTFKLCKANYKLDLANDRAFYLIHNGDRSISSYLIKFSIDDKIEIEVKKIYIALSDI